MLHIKSCRWVEDYKLALLFDNGTEGIADLQDLPVTGSVFEPLKDKEIFKNFQLLYSGVTTWLDGTLDVAPEYLYFLANKNKPELRKQFQGWGYIECRIKSTLDKGTRCNAKIHNTL